jgi:serine protease Do
MTTRHWLCGTLLLVAGAVAAQAQPAPLPEPAASAAAPPVSLSARKVYEQARSQLVQIRTLLKGQGSQTSVGSGFFVSAEGHIVTNFHVVSEAALQPQWHTLVSISADGREAPVQILTVDVLHDLALLKVDAAHARADFDALGFRTSSQPLAQGERMYSLGNPLDVGFAVVEGNYNGLAERSFYPQIFFSGSLNSGMSGGPALDQEGRVIGVNVSRQLGSDQVSFLVPSEFAAALLAQGRQAQPMKLPAWPVVSEQLMAHQTLLTERFMRQGWRTGTHPRYTVPVPVDRFVRCWGDSRASPLGGLEVEASECGMPSRVFVGEFTTGNLSTRHESHDGRRLGALRFAARYSAGFRNEWFLKRLYVDAGHLTRPTCHEDYLDRGGLPLRAVVCLRAYKKLPKLYDVAVFVATLDQDDAGVQGGFDARGVSYPNAMKLSRHYLEAYGWAAPRR